MRKDDDEREPHYAKLAALRGNGRRTQYGTLDDYRNWDLAKLSEFNHFAKKGDGQEDSKNCGSL